MTSKEKLDAALGISADLSVDDFLAALTMENDVEGLSSAFDKITDQVHSDIAIVDSAKSSPLTTLQLSTITDSMKEVEDLVMVSKNLFKHVYEQIITTSLIDSEVIGSAAKLLESIHINIAEFISMYKSRLNFVDKLLLMEIAHRYDLEKMAIKLKYDLEKMNMRLDKGATDAEEGKINSTFESIIKAIADADAENETQELKADSELN